MPRRWRAALRGRHVLIVTDEHVAPLYLARVRDGLASLTHATLVLPAGEAHKTLDSTSRVFDALAATRREPRRARSSRSAAA